MANNFSLDRAPLRANLNIEASAGTGKTYTLERIVCRLIENYGLSIQHILLVTYTEKAASELRQRIQNRLSLRLKEIEEQALKHNILQALNHFNEANISTIHSFFRRCLEQFTLETTHSGIADDIGGHTCFIQDLLLEELQKSDFSQEDRKILHLAGLVQKSKNEQFQLQKLLDICENPNLENFWREHPDFRLCPGKAELNQLERISNEFKQQQGTVYQILLELALFDWTKEIFANRSSITKLKNLPQSYDGNIALQFFGKLKNWFKTQKLTKKPLALENILKLLLEKPSHPQKMGEFLAPYIELLCCLRPEYLEQNNDKFIEANGSIEEWPYYQKALMVQQFFTAFSSCFQADAHSLQNLFAAKFLLLLRQRIAPQLQMSPMLNGIRSFSDMVEGLYRVLVLKQYGDAPTLLRYLRQQYRCALIDEFQDTDPIQWQILFCIFGQGQIESADPIQRSHNYIIVGDPKQSIYRFRGVSPQLYYFVQQGCDYCFRLGANYRSNSLVVSACNQFFSNMWGEIFVPVSVGEKEGTRPLLVIPSQNPKDDEYGRGEQSSELCFLDCRSEIETAQPLTKTELQQTTLNAIEEQVLRLLSQNYRIASQAVRPKDIAILLERKKDCANMQQRLQNFGIPTSYSEKRSIFGNHYAQALHYFFQALCEPHELSHSLRLLLSPLFALNITEARLLLELPKPNETQFNIDSSNKSYGQFILTFIQQLSFWQEQIDQGKKHGSNGQLLNVLQELFTYGKKIYQALQTIYKIDGKTELLREELQQEVYQRILSQPQYQQTQNNFPNDLTAAHLGERERQNNCESYNNLRHLLEILAEQQIRQNMSCRELSCFMATEIQQAMKGSIELSEFEQQNSSQNAVNIMTIHASKGLEFPLVFLSIGMNESQNDMIILETNVTSNENQGQTICYQQTAYLSGNSQVKQFAAQEEYQELQRLFYVAMTRASCKIYLPLHASCKKKLPYFKLLGESLYGKQAADDLTIDLGAAVEKLIEQHPQNFSLRSNKNLVSSGKNLENLNFLGQLQKRLQSLSAATFPEDTEEKPECQLQNDNLAHHFPAVNSFTSLQKQISKEGIFNTSHNFSIEGSMEENFSSFDKKQKEQDEQTIEELFSEATQANQKELCWHELLLSPGAALGNLLHDVLENADYQMIEQSSLDDLLEQDNNHFKNDFFKELSLKSRRYFPRNWIRQAYPALCRMIWHTLHSDLTIPPVPITDQNTLKNNPTEIKQSTQLRLCQLAKKQRQHELEFLFSVPKDCAIDSLLFAQQAGSKIQVTKGFLKGFIDLLFLHDGKLYLLDWKSNLAASSLPMESAIQELDRKTIEVNLQQLQQQLYRDEALKEIMAKHHYQMQYLIYLAAVYYYLKLQYGDSFKYSQHFGGCYYLFLRGITNSIANDMQPNKSGIYFDKPDEIWLQQIIQGLGISLEA